VLDVGCGTGKSFLPMLPRGWEVTGCDISPAMLALAEEKAHCGVELVVSDMRELPSFGEFDLVWALDDAINYLPSVEELESALRGMRDNLAETGLLLFDVNELLVYRTVFAETEEIEGTVGASGIRERRRRMLALARFASHGSKWSGVTAVWILKTVTAWPCIASGTSLKPRCFQPWSRLDWNVWTFMATVSMAFRSNPSMRPSTRRRSTSLAGPGRREMIRDEDRVMLDCGSDAFDAQAPLRRETGFR